MAKNGGFYVMSNKVHESSVFWKRRDSKFYSFSCFQLNHYFDLSNEHNIQMCL